MSKGALTSCCRPALGALLALQVFAAPAARADDEGESAEGEEKKPDLEISEEELEEEVEAPESKGKKEKKQEKEEVEPEDEADESPLDSIASPYDDAEGEEEEEEEGEEVEDLDSVEVSEDKVGFFPSSFDGEQAVARDRGVNLFTARPTRPMALTLVVDHRARKNLFSGEDAFFDYLGLDKGGMKIGIGLRFGIIEGLDAGIYRLNDGGTVAFDAYELDVRYAFLRQEKFFVDVSARAGITWFVQEDADDAVGGFGQIFVDRVLLDMLLVGAGFQIHSDSTNEWKSNDEDVDPDFSGAVQGLVEWRMVDPLAITLEASYAVVGYASKYPNLTLALKILTHRHVFSIMLTNTQFINADGIVSNTERDFSDLIFGFQILREFNFKD